MKAQFHLIFISLSFCLSSLITHACGDSNLSLLSTTDNGDGTYTISMELCVAGGVTGVTDGAQNNTASFAFAIYSSNPVVVSSFSPATLPTVYSGETGFGELIGGVTSFPPFSQQENLVYNFDYCTYPFYACIVNSVLCGNIHVNCQTFEITLNALPDSIRALGIEGENNVLNSCNGPELLIDFVAIALNVDWKSVSAAQINPRQSLISWETNSEVNNDYFEVQKRGNSDFNWKTIAKVDGNGTSSINHFYSFIDENFNNELIYYRIQQTDFDGVKDYSPVVSLHPSKEIRVTAYPNPANEWITISNAKNMKARILTSNGKQIENFQILNESQTISCALFVDGLYLIELENEHEIQRIKFFIQH